MSDDDKIYFIVEVPITEAAITIEGERDGRRDMGVVGVRNLGGAGLMPLRKLPDMSALA